MSNVQLPTLNIQRRTSRISSLSGLGFNGFHFYEVRAQDAAADSGRLDDDLGARARAVKRVGGWKVRAGG